jgi:CheY-like chemotaxis protein
MKSKILLVEDDFAIRQILFRLLDDEDYFVVAAASASEALALASTTKFDLALLDLNKPVEGGWETFEQLSKQNPALPIILITAPPNRVFPALASGVVALLEKPLDFVTLFDTIRSLLQEPAGVRMARMAVNPTIFPHIPPQAKSAWLSQ